MDEPYKLTDWNKIIDDVNKVITKSPDGAPDKPECKAKDPIDHDDGSKPWSVDDVQKVRDALTSTCSKISFSKDLKIWKQEFIDEITAAIGQAWCDCKCDPKSEDGLTIPIWGRVQTVDCSGSAGCAGADGFAMWPQAAPTVLALNPIAKPKVTGRSVALRWHDETDPRRYGECAWGLIDCEGNATITEIPDFSALKYCCGTMTSKNGLGECVTQEEAPCATPTTDWELVIHAENAMCDDCDKEGT